MHPPMRMHVTTITTIGYDFDQVQPAFLPLYMGADRIAGDVYNPW